LNTQPRHPKCRALPVELHPDIHFSAMIPRRTVKIKFFLSVVIPVVKAAFMPLSAIGESPANAGVTRLSGVSHYSVPDTATALPKQARYQLRYTRLLSFLSGWAYSPKPGAIPTSLYPDIHFSAMIPRQRGKSWFSLHAVKSHEPIRVIPCYPTMPQLKKQQEAGRFSARLPHF
jgi:hypothetical protein